MKIKINIHIIYKKSVYNLNKINFIKDLYSILLYKSYINLNI
jgi:hypothetical protein